MIHVVFNWRAIPLVAGSLASGSLLWAVLEAIGLRRDVASASGMVLAGLILVIVDYVLWRRRNAPTTPLWRLVLPQSGGHVFFIPCWAQGAFLILLGGTGLGESPEVGTGSILSLALKSLGMEWSSYPDRV